MEKKRKGFRRFCVYLYGVQLLVLNVLFSFMMLVTGPHYIKAVGDVFGPIIALIISLWAVEMILAPFVSILYWKHAEKGNFPKFLYAMTQIALWGLPVLWVALLLTYSAATRGLYFGLVIGAMLIFFPLPLEACGLRLRHPKGSLCAYILLLLQMRMSAMHESRRGLFQFVQSVHQWRS